MSDYLRADSAGAQVQPDDQDKDRLIGDKDTDGPKIVEEKKDEDIGGANILGGMFNRKKGSMGKSGDGIEDSTTKAERLQKEEAEKEQNLKKQLKEMKEDEYKLYKYKLIASAIIVPLVYLVFYFLISKSIENLGADVSSS